MENTMHKVYLAGPIWGLEYDEGQDWRRVVKNSLAPVIDCYSPLRGHEFLRGKGQIVDMYDDHSIRTNRGILRRDHHDCVTSDLIFINFLDSRSKSLGTAMEIAWAYDRHIPIIIIMEKSGNLHEHPMINEALTYRVDSLEEGIILTRSVLLSD
jgi:nucleoside 2-deoxyribosyltransferase